MNMIRKYPNLCKPITIGNVTFRNRMFSAPMSGAEITPECTIGPNPPRFMNCGQKAERPRSRDTGGDKTGRTSGDSIDKSADWRYC